MQFNKMAKNKKSKKPYKQRTDLEKIIANWNKTLNLFYRDEYSVAIIRSATTVEIAANHFIRTELIDKLRLPSEFVNTLLQWANGLNGKFEKLIRPIAREPSFKKTVNKIAKEIKQICKERNSVVHQGEFKKRSTAQETIKQAHRVILRLVNLHKKSFDLRKL